MLLTIGVSPASPGANDDASGVAVLIGLGTRLANDPPRDLEVWFLSTGSEEGFLGGMRACMEKHSNELTGRRPLFVSLEMTGSGNIVYFEGEGFLRRYGYGPEAVALAESAASEREFGTVRRVKTAPFASDALVATHFGVPAVTVASTNSAGYVPHYHWGTDTPENVDIRSVELALRFCERMVRRLASNSEGRFDHT